MRAVGSRADALKIPRNTAKGPPHALRPETVINEGMSLSINEGVSL